MTNGPSPLSAVTSLTQENNSTLLPSHDKRTISTKRCYFPSLILQNRSQTRSVSLSDMYFAQFSQPLRVKYLTRFSKYCAYMHFIQFFSPFFKIKFIQNDSSLQFETIRHDLYKFMSHCVHICFILIVQDSFKMTAVSNLKPSGITYILCSQVLRADCTRFTQTTLA